MRLIINCAMLFALAVLSQYSVAEPASDPTEVWEAWSARATLHVYPQSLEPIGVDVRHGGKRIADGSRIEFDDRDLGTLVFRAPFGHFEGFLDGRLVFDAGLEFVHAGSRVKVDQLIVQPDPNNPIALHLYDGKGRLLFTARQVHVYTRPEQNMLVMERMDVHIATDLAEALGLPEWDDRFVGELALDARLHIPAGARTQVLGDACPDRPNWPTDGHELDVLLIGMGTVQDRGTVNDNGEIFEIVTPSSTLANRDDLGTADVPWFQKFTGTFPPYNNDQHPYLIWNFYRIADGRLEQIGASGVKHAFLTINTSCAIHCGDGGVAGGNGHILWPGCGDVYGVGNNDSSGDLGPRDEVNPRTGVFVSTGSFFDQNSDGVQDNSSSGNGENRMQIARADLEIPGAQYLFESWYVIRDDIDIFNSMGFHPITPINTSGDNWSYGLGTFQQGPAVDQWAAPGGTPESGAMNMLHQSGQDGHFKVLARAEQLPDERWRYSYVVMNYDVDHGIETFTIQANSQVDTLYFHDPDPEPANDWTTSAGGGITFQAPVGNPIAWGMAYSFGFDSDAGPVARDVHVEFGPTGSSQGITLELLGPGLTEAVFIDGFE